MACYYPYSGAYYTKLWENEINDLCDRFVTDLSSRKWSIFQDIDNWRKLLLTQINDHADQQKTLLDREYQKQKAKIETIRREYLDTARQFDYDNDDKKIKELINQCKLMNFELRAQEYSEQSIVFIQVMTEEKLQQKQLIESKGEKRSDNTSTNNPNRGFGDFTGSNASTRGDTYGLLTSTASVQINRSATTRQDSADSRSLSNSTRDQNSLIPECPVCCMIFSPNMTLNNRKQHIAQH